MSTPGAGAAPFGSITDVPGVGVGHHQRTGRGWQTGTTVILVRGGATPGVDVRGGGPGTRETDALAPSNLVGSIHAVCLSGGSAYGLAAADGVVGWLESEGLGVPVGADPGAVVPVVPAAVIFDLGRGGAFGNRPDASFGARAIQRAAGRGAPVWGAVGAGCGAVAGGLQGGVGTAARTVPVPAPSSAGGEEPAAENPAAVVVGALAVVNANGTVVDPETGLLWSDADRRRRRPSTAERRALRDAVERSRPQSLNTTIGVVATSAALDKSEVSKLATVAHDGLARAVRPAHSMVDGDTVFALATGRVALPTAEAERTDRPGIGGARTAALNALLGAAADVFADACAHAVLAARRVGDAPAYADLCPSAVRC